MDVLCITDELRKIRLRRVGHVVCREEHNVIKKVWRLPVDGRHGRGQQRLRMRDVVRRDMEVAEVEEGTAKIKNERCSEEKHGGGRGFGGDGKD